MSTRPLRALLFLAFLSTAAQASPESAPGLTASPVLPTAPAQAAAPAPAPRRTVLLLGDSLIATGFGEYLQNQLAAHPRIRCERRAKSSTGLARPDFFNWLEVGQQEVQQHQPDVVVVILGGNDGQALHTREGRATVAWGKPDWQGEYRQRLTDFVTAISAPGRKIVWLELPATSRHRFEQKLTLIRDLQREVIAGREDAVHLDTRPFFTDARGKALKQARVDGFRKPMRLRMTDGVHFTVAGGRYFANKVYPEVLGVLGLEAGEQHTVRPAATPVKPTMQALAPVAPAAPAAP
ncbi:SGNH/GDSL hydrolase family protein [Corallococcus carmarthensis]|uniref:DUF459 domain-containing protein n=1 Tax=Corallococcus carmarthensis TaxID=2316728 RepID=A0A3A8K8E8_9BACT|nr:DUF459 domain-containing protein [Corallococcus carmarthensis]NOK21414.1 DUF459 domain-containing protein [Corallococcus carmarthensis]RKG98063.1 DUF459 domain-containing protein [Corallococcus carmarthensis]